MRLYDRALAVTRRPETILPERDALAGRLGVPARGPHQRMAA
jgi:hypothetical protein